MRQSRMCNINVCPGTFWETELLCNRPPLPHSLNFSHIKHEAYTGIFHLARVAFEKAKLRTIIFLMDRSFIYTIYDLVFSFQVHIWIDIYDFKARSNLYRLLCSFGSPSVCMYVRPPDIPVSLLSAFSSEALFNILNLAKYIWTPWTGFSECTISCDTVPGVPKSLPY